MQTIFKAYPDYNDTNTVVVSPYQNTIAKYAPNDLLMELWDLEKSSSTYLSDYYVEALRLYLLGLDSLGQKPKSLDIREYSSRMSLTNMQLRLKASNEGFTPA